MPGARRNKAAIIWEGVGDRRTLIYFDLQREVSMRQRPQVAWDEEGDRVALYMPLVPELAIAMLACARIGAVHASCSAGSAPSHCAIASTMQRACS
jgi:acetyl-CoA synthetase